MKTALLILLVLLTTTTALASGPVILICEDSPIAEAEHPFLSELIRCPSGPVIVVGDPPPAPWWLGMWRAAMTVGML